MANLEQVIVKPLLTEKTSEATEKTNRYSFIVKREANKNQIKIAVEKLFDVKVTGINTAVMPGKVKRFGRFTKKTTKFKKAHVQLKDGQKIEFFKGV